jgi:cytochrome c553
VSGVINFPDNIAPLFSVDRGPATCTACHGAAGVSPNLTNTPSGSGRLQSYESLTLGPVAFDSNGQPIINVEDDGELVVQRADALVQTGGSGDTSRTSLLFEKMLEKPLHGPALPAMTVDHRGMLNASELRVLTEWADVGGQYYNDPFNVAPGQPRTLDKIRSVVALSEDDYNNNVHPVLMAQCAGCHQAFGGNGGPTNPPNSSFKPNNFVLTGDLKGDYDVTLTMVTDVCHPAANPLLLRPVTFGISAFPHPAVGTAPLLHSVLAVGDSNYNTIYAWIASGSGQCP